VKPKGAIMSDDKEYKGYGGAKENPDGTWVVGGAYGGAKQNIDGTWVVGGAYGGAKQNLDGTWVCA
tara:strand:+ start:3972 stop:4169 length:198 start_codon:yes stop_codon:yes gene_type:complete